MEMAKVKEVIMKHVDEKGLAKDLMFEIMIPYLEKFVADTANPYDDKLIVWIKEYMEKQA